MDRVAKAAQKEGTGASRCLSWAVAILAAIACAVIACVLQGCASYTPLTPEQIDATVEAVTNSNAYAEIVAMIKDKETKKKIVEAIEKEDVPLIIDNEEDAVPFSSLGFTYGKVKGSTCQLAPTARIKNLKVNNSGMSYEWIAGGCEELGAGGGHDHTKTSACLFVKNAAGQWVGGRFDAISSDRLTRGFKNITGEQYGGWKRDEFLASSEVLFVIVSDNGKWRTNVIRGSK